jgi:hypothetical protein
VSKHLRFSLSSNEVSSGVKYPVCCVHVITVVAQLVEALGCKIVGSIPDGVIGIFNNIILPAALGSEVNSASKRNRSIFWGVKSAGV